MKLRDTLFPIDWNVSDLVRAFFDSDMEKRYLIVSIVWLLLLYATGIYFWGIFFNWRQTPLNYHDWQKVNLPRLDVIRDALVYGELPLHVAQTEQLHYFTDRFFTMPDVITTPQQIVLYWIDVDTFAVFDLLIEFTIGAIGLYLFKRKYGISLFAFSVMYFLVGFNGYVQAHYAVGHITWGGYFLFPLFILLITDFIDDKQNWAWVAKVAFLMFYMLLIGSQHHFVWSLLFLGGLGIAAWKKIRWIIRSGFFAGMLGAVRLLPPILTLSVINSGDVFGFRTGFPSLQDVFSSLISVRPLGYYFSDLPERWIYNTGYWEFNIYVGWVGMLIILWFGVILWIIDLKVKKRFSQLMLPTMLLIFLSLGANYERLGLTHIPLLATERVTSRMIGLPLVVLIMISGIFLDEWVRGKPSLLRYLPSVFGLLWLSRDLFFHLQYWDVKAVAPALILHNGRIPIQGNSISNHGDPAYIAILLLGILITLIFSLFLLLLVNREKSAHLLSIPSNG